MNLKINMGQNRVIYLLGLFVLLVLASCSDSIVSKANHEFREGKKGFYEEFNNNNLFSHFPKKLTNDYKKMRSSPPGFKCQKHTGFLYLTCPLDKPGAEIGNILKDSVLYYSEYANNDNTILNLSELKQNVFPEAKCNLWYANKYPIPYFESFDFGLGEQESKKMIDGESYYNYTHTIPPDLKVYVISAEPGYFWKIECKEKRPESLKEWKNGYSRGIAISDEKNIVVYWSMVW